LQKEAGWQDIPVTVRSYFNSWAFNNLSAGRSQTTCRSSSRPISLPIVSRFGENIRLSSYLVNPLSKNQN